jgi:indolepyruvate ferredoxin oxidoreductase
MTVLIYDQTCAAEKRRRRKRGIEPEPDRRVFINSRVCEGCGDCGVKSNCVSVQPLETDLGRKRVIDQSSCNKDYSCLDGFCPSFVTVHGGKLRKGRARADAATLPAVLEPQVPTLEHPFGILITGVGGTGVVTIGAVLGMAAHLEGYGVGLIDMAGLAQKGGAVTTHMRLAPRRDDIHAIRIATEEADTVLACDIVVAGSKKSLMAIRPGRSNVFVNIHETYPGDFTRDADFTLPSRRLVKAIGDRAGPGAHFIEAQRLATALLGDAIATNMFMVGYAWQQGGIPLSKAAILEAIRLNGVEEAMNVAAFEWGRRAAHDPEGVARLAGLTPPEPADESLEALVERRAAFLAAYQGRRYARRYRNRVAAIAAAETKVAAGDALARAVAESLFHLMAIKDEYEVARLFADREFEAELRETFESWERLEFHLAPPAFAKPDPRTGQPAKKAFGPSTMRLFRLLAAFRRIRNTPLDPFRWTADRRFERKLLADYLAVLDEIAASVGQGNHDVCMRIATYPLKIRGYGHVRRAQARPALAERDTLLETLRAPEAPPVAEAAE